MRLWYIKQGIVYAMPTLFKRPSSQMPKILVGFCPCLRHGVALWSQRQRFNGVERGAASVEQAPGLVATGFVSARPSS
ncbi:hypothetical protein RRG08_034341 [Elysia crispata]|uniref:Uncharacterized protein n=1 Tax=Elysia crispata TaxID=231223 RepID=A0AAE0YD06_9GAST|nr:hypothetical protein RRG08_034341 [Elysia crispata]